MRVLFVQDNGINESLALTEVSACLRARGHATRLLLEREEKGILHEAAGFAPGLVFLPCSVLDHRSTLRLADRLRERVASPIALGGTYPTFFPGVVSHPAVAYTIRGECEESLADLAESLERGNDPAPIPNLVTRQAGGGIRANPVRPPIADLDRLPLPDRDLYFRYPFIRRFPWKKFLASRGCPGSCTYCYQPPLRALYDFPAGWVRRKSVHRVIEEIRAVRAVSPLGHVHFADDLFGSDVGWLEQFAARYPTEVGIPFTCNTTPEAATHFAVWALKRAGCWAIGFGIESGAEPRRREVLGRRTSDDEIRRAAARIREAGMRLVTFNMLGTPGETIDDAFATVRLNRAIRPDYARVTLAVPVPGTALARRFERGAGAAGEHVDFRDRDGGAPSAAFEGPARREMASLYALFVWAAASPSAERWARSLARAPWNPLFELLSTLRALRERRIFRLPWIAAARYFLHVGPPDRRSHNFVGLP